MQTNFTQGTQPPMPPQACDSHVHVFLPDQFSYDPLRQYTPPAATIPELVALQGRLGMSRVVLVQPSCYGTDNRALVTGLAELGSSRTRGIAVLDLDTTSDAELQLLVRAGVRGLRFNLSVQQEGDASQLRRRLAVAQERCAPLGWHLQINAGAATINALASELELSQVPVIFDHFAGGADAAETVVRLLRSGKGWVKLSAPYRASGMPAYTDLDGLVQRFVHANPQQLLWGSDWPHTGGTGVRKTAANDIEPFRQEDAVVTLNLLKRWVPDEATRESILVRNPADLYGF